MGATGFLVQVLLVGRATKRFGEARVIVFGLGVLVASMLLQPIIREPLGAVVLMSTLMGGHSIAFPSAGALISRSTPPDVQGSVNGLLMAGNALARIVMPPALGFVYSAAGPDWPYYVCAALASVALVVGVQAIALRDSEVRAKAAIV